MSLRLMWLVVHLLIFRTTDSLLAVLPISLNVLVNAVCDNLTGLLVAKFLSALDRDPSGANQVNHQNVLVHAGRRR